MLTSFWGSDQSRGLSLPLPALRQPAQVRLRAQEAYAGQALGHHQTRTYCQLNNVVKQIVLYVQEVVLPSNLLYKMGHHFLDTKYYMSKKQLSIIYSNYIKWVIIYLTYSTGKIFDFCHKKHYQIEALYMYQTSYVSILP